MSDLPAGNRRPAAAPRAGGKDVDDLPPWAKTAGKVAVGAAVVALGWFIIKKTGHEDEVESTAEKAKRKVKQAGDKAKGLFD